MRRLAYLVNPRSIGEVATREKWAARLPRFLVPPVLAMLPPRVDTSFLHDERDHVGWAINLRATPTDLTRRPDRLDTRLKQAVHRAVAEGAGVIGVSESLATAARQVRAMGEAAGLATVDGLASRLLACVPSLKLVGAATGRNPARSEIVLLGGGSAAGRVTAFLVAHEAGFLALWGQSQALDRLALHIRHETGLSVPRIAELGAFADVDTIIVAGGRAGDPDLPAPTAWLPRLRPGACVIDLCFPPLLDAVTAGLRPDVLVVQGGAYTLPEALRWDRPFCEDGELVTARGASPALTEALALALTGAPELDAAGREPSLARVRAVGRILGEAGFHPTQVRAFGAILSREYLETFRPQRPRWSGRF